MRNREVIEKYYAQAVKGLNEIILNDKDIWYSYVVNLPEDLQAVYTIVVLHQQASNGGLHQYFFNSYGQFAYLTLENLKVIKAFKTADILQQAINKVNAEAYTLNEFRELIFNRKLDKIVNFDDELADILDNLDTQYYKSEEDLEYLLANFLIK